MIAFNFALTCTKEAGVLSLHELILEIKLFLSLEENDPASPKPGALEEVFARITKPFPMLLRRLFPLINNIHGNKLYHRINQHGQIKLSALPIRSVIQLLYGPADNRGAPDSGAISHWLYYQTLSLGDMDSI